MWWAKCSSIFFGGGVKCLQFAIKEELWNSMQINILENWRRKMSECFTFGLWMYCRGGARFYFLVNFPFHLKEQNVRTVYFLHRLTCACILWRWILIPCELFVSLEGEKCENFLLGEICETKSIVHCANIFLHEQSHFAACRTLSLFVTIFVCACVDECLPL